MPIKDAYDNAMYYFIGGILRKLLCIYVYAVSVLYVHWKGVSSILKSQLFEQ